MIFRDHLNAPTRTPKDDRRADTLKLLIQTAIAIGLWIVVLNQFFNLLTGD